MQPAVEAVDRGLQLTAPRGDLAGPTQNAGFSHLGPEPGEDEQLRSVLVAQIAECARHCGRVFFRSTNEGMQIVAKADKGNEPKVIERLKKLYGS
ncbi:hypothetical protein ABH930_002074 [Kitasatospora sp. GAS204A]|uniref:hypothetical protein n=1 Tax=unclassified Kitasatospora TaxID=2633591 RepID=UPI00247345A0|nr:hypothetical protein [Kitasatospora sp. GAS204B]MDH6116063.1 hypothetical protein [Kitasatospora sp. GAS204B]